MSIFCYQRHINNWRQDTASLTLEQRGAYSELIDWFYSTHGRLPADLKKLCRMLGVQSHSERTATAYVINHFFTEKDGFLYQNGCVKELTRILSRSEKAAQSANAKYNKNNDLGSANAERTLCERSANHKPSTNNHSKEAKASLLEIEKFNEFWNAFPKQRAGSKDKALKAYLKASKRSTMEAINEGVVRYAASDEVKRGYAKGAAAWLNDDRWKTDYSVSPRRDNGNNRTGKATVGFTQIAIDLANEEKRNRDLRPAGGVHGDKNDGDDNPFV